MKTIPSRGDQNPREMAVLGPPTITPLEGRGRHADGKKEGTLIAFSGSGSFGVFCGDYCEKKKRQKKNRLLVWLITLVSHTIFCVKFSDFFSSFLPYFF